MIYILIMLQVNMILLDVKLIALYKQSKSAYWNTDVRTFWDNNNNIEVFVFRKNV